MGKVQKFEDLTIFQMARDLTKEVYAITKDGEFHKDTRFVQQIRAAAGAIMDNFASKREERLSSLRLSRAGAKSAKLT